MADIHWSNGESAIAGHSAVDGTMRQQSAVHIIGSIAGDGSNHVSGICKQSMELELELEETTTTTAEISRRHFGSHFVVVALNCH